MPYWSTTTRALALLLCIDACAPLLAQGTGDSPYSAFGFGDMMRVNQAAQALMGGAGIGYVEPFGVLTGNPASYAGLQRPCFEAGALGEFTTLKTSDQTSHRANASFSGFTIGVPFGKKYPYGLALGIAPASKVDYTITDTYPISDGTLNYEYSGTGGINRVFAGLARGFTLRKADTLGNAGTRLNIGANFDFLFGSLEQTRKAIYPAGYGYSNTRAFSSLVLRAPTANVGMLFSGQLISRDRIKAAQERRRKKDSARLEKWRLMHPMDSTHIPVARQFRDPEPWRYTIGIAGDIPTVFSATRTELETSYVYAFDGTETTRDTIHYDAGSTGHIRVPYSIGLGLSVQNSRWLFTAEARRRDWSAIQYDVPQYQPLTPLRANMVYSVGMRFRPSSEGDLTQRMVYRAGLRYSEDETVVHGVGLNTASVSAGVSVPLNAVNTNSYFNFGFEAGQRGTQDNGLIQQNFVNLWIGLTVTPWHGERWFRPFQIQ